jgi:hypothetical protein
MNSKENSSAPLVVCLFLLSGVFLTYDTPRNEKEQEALKQKVWAERKAKWQLAQV